MSNVSAGYRKFVPPFLKALIDPSSMRLERFVRAAIEKAGPGDHILDAGAGECRNRVWITNQTYIALDTAWGDPSWDYAGLDVVAHLEKTPFRPNSFDLLICTQVLEHLREPQAVLNEFHRLAKRGGTLCLSAPQGWGVHQAPHDYYRYTHYGLRHLLEKAGFDIVSITPSCGYFGYLANRLTVFPKTLFWPIRRRWLRILLFPFELAAYGVFVLLLPIVLNRIDFLDKQQNYTLNYMVLAHKGRVEEER